MHILPQATNAPQNGRNRLVSSNGVSVFVTSWEGGGGGTTFDLFIPLQKS